MGDYKKTLNIAIFAIIGIMAVVGFLGGKKLIDKEVSKE